MASPKIIFTVINDLSYDQRMIRICHSLVRNGFQVTLVGREKKHSIPLIKQPFQQVRLNSRFQKGKLMYIEYNIRLFFFLLKNQFHILGSIDLDTLLPCFITTQLKSKPLVFDAHEYFTETPEVVRRPFTRRIWELIARLIIPRLKYAYTVSASLQKLLSERYKIPFGLIRNVTDSSNSNSNQSTNQSIILYQGVLNEGRGLEAIIQAMPQLPNAQLWLAGEGELSDYLRQFVQDLLLQQQVKFLGYLPPLELKKVTRQATVGLNLLENRGLSYYYSLANKTFDYIHAGLPAIHPNFPEYSALNKAYEIGVLVDDLEETTLVNALKNLLDNPERCAQLKANCLIAATHLNWKQEEKKLLAIYQSVLVVSRI